MSIPPLSPQQRARALERATAARRRRADLKRRLKRGDLSIGAVIAEGPRDPAVAQLRVVELIESMPGVGRVTADRIMGELGIARSRRVRGLGPLQAKALTGRFETP